MRIKFLGATTTVTGSKYIIKGEKHNILIDCGLYQGENAQDLNQNIYHQLKAERINAIILTHAHLDHCGYLPKFVKDGYKGPIFSTNATKDLAQIIMLDNASIQMNELKKINKNIKKESLKTHVLYERIHVSQTLSLFETIEFNQSFHFKEFEILFKKAGHILGASSVVISGQNKTVEFSGDLGREDDLTMYPPQKPNQKLDALILESTYGDRLHPEEDYLKVLGQAISEAKEKNSTLVIPAFSVARSQTIMFALFELFQKYPHLETQVFVDSPMTQAVTRLYHKYPDLHKIDLETLKDIESKFHFVKFPKQTKNLSSKGNKIILTAAGMLSGGNVLKHLIEHGQDPDNIFLLVGYQAKTTIGYDLLSNKRTISLEHGSIKFRAQILQAKCFSSHPDMKQLINWCKGLDCRYVFLIHGEEESKKKLKQELNKRLSAVINIASTGQEVTID